MKGNIKALHTLVEIVKSDDEVLETLKTFTDDQKSQVFTTLIEVIRDDIRILLTIFDAQKSNIERIV